MPKRTVKSNVRRGRTSFEPARTNPPTAASLRDAAYDAIKHRIITCAFRPGEYINELQLSSMLKIGRTPVHQALDRLMIEGMVDVIPRKGVIVRPVSLNEVLQIIETRLVNESYCSRLAAERANNSDIAELADVLKRTKHWTSMRNIENMMLLDREFHLLVARAAKNDVLTELLRSLHERSLRFWFISLNAPAQYESVQDQHDAIFAAIHERDPDKSEAAMRAHIECFRTNVSQFLQEEVRFFCGCFGVDLTAPIIPEISLLSQEAACGRLVEIVGDGSFYFNNPTAVYALSKQYALPIFSVVLDNSGWAAVKGATLRVYPNGQAKTKGSFQASLAADMDFSKTVEAAGGYGERLVDPTEVPAAISRCLAQVRKGRSALLRACVTKL